MSNYRAIVVGCGGISNAWFPPLAAEGVRVVGLVDLRREAAQAQADKHKLADARIFTDPDQAFRDLRGQADFVVDLTIPDAHCQVTCRALEAGFHVIGEKPMAASMDQARQMVAASEKAGKLYMVGQSRRWDIRHETVRNTLRTGTIGRITTLNCDFYVGAHFGGFRDEMASPLILDMSIHHFDLARMISGLDPVAVYCEEFNPVGSWYKGDVAASAIFQMTDNVRFTYRGSWCAEGCHTSWNGDWRCIGEKGTLLYEKDQPPTGEVVTAMGGFHSPKAPLPITPSDLVHGGQHGSIRELLRYFREGVMPQTECHDNIKSLAMVFAAVESARLGKRIRIDEI